MYTIGPTYSKAVCVEQYMEEETYSVSFKSRKLLAQLG